MGLVECNRTQNLLLGICACVNFLTWSEAIYHSSTLYATLLYSNTCVDVYYLFPPTMAWTYVQQWKLCTCARLQNFFYLFAHQGLSIFPWTDWTGMEHPLKIWHEHPSSNHLSKYRTSNVYTSMSSFHTTLCCKLKTSFLSLPCREFYKTVKRRADAFFKANNIVIKYLANSFMT